MGVPVLMAIARRVYLYAIALIALGMVLTGLAGLLELALEVAIERLAPPTASLGDLDAPGRAAFAGALSLIGLVAWLIHWQLAERALRRDPPAERASIVRKLFLYAVLLAGGLIVVFASRAALADAIALAAGRKTIGDLIAGDLVKALALALVAAAFWLYHLRPVAADRAQEPEVGRGAAARRWFVYTLAFVGLLLLLFGAAGLIRALWEAALPPPAARELGRDWLVLAVGGRLASIVVGLVTWLVTWRWSDTLLTAAWPDPESRSILRKVYLYLVLGVALATTVWNVGQVLYGLLRIALLGGRVASGWGGVLHDLGAPLAAALVFGLAWWYHADAIEREARLAGERRAQATIRWLYAYLAALVGLVTFGVGLGGTLATLLDLASQPGAVRPTSWWEDRIALFTTLAAVGLPLWLWQWHRLQSEDGSGSAPTFAWRSLWASHRGNAAVDGAAPASRGSPVRRVYLLLAFAAAVLTLLTSGAYALYQLLRLALGQAWTAGQTSDLISAASAAAVAAVLLAYHLTILRGDASSAGRPQSSAVAGDAAIVAVALVRASDRATWAEAERALRAAIGPGAAVELREVDPGTVARVRRALDEEAAPST